MPDPSGKWLLAAVGNSSDIWSEPEGEAFINLGLQKTSLLNTSDSSEVRNAQLRVASVENMNIGGNERALQIVDHDGNEGDGTTFRATVTGQWKFIRGGDKFHIS